MANSVDKSKHISLKSKFTLLKNLITVFYGVSETKDVVNTRNSDFKAKYGSNGAEYVQALKQYRKLSKIDLEKFTEEQEEERKKVASDINKVRRLLKKHNLYELVYD